MIYLFLLISAAVLAWFFHATSQPAESYIASKAPEIYETAGSKHHVERVPRIIWSYWHSEKKPIVATQCLKNWQACNPEFEVRMLHADNVKDFISADKLPRNFHQLVFQHQADWLRLALLDQYGGIWLDSSIFLTASLDWAIALQAQTGAEYLGYEIEDWKTAGSAYPIIENWCMVAIKASPFVHAWLLEFTLALEDGKAYLAGLKAQGTYDETLQKIIRPEYFLMHVTAQRVLRNHDGYKICLLDARDSAFFYHAKSDFVLSRLFWRLLFLRRPEAVPVVIKLRGRERRKLEKFLKYGIYRRKSIVGVHLAGVKK